MNAWLKQFFFNIRHSYWFIPSVLAIVSILAAAALVAVDIYWLTSVPDKYKWLFDTEPQGARAILSTVAGSTITVAGVVFSMTMMSVSHTTSTYGPRLMLNFLKDSKNQFTLGIFIATFIYCLLVLRTIQGGGADDQLIFVPHLAVFGAIGMALLSVAVLIGFLHHIPHSINIGNVVADRGHSLIARLEKIFTTEDTGGVQQALQLQDKTKLDVYTKHFGYVQALDYSGLVDFCKASDIVVSLYKKPGDFIAIGEPLLLIHSTDDLDNKTTEGLSDKLPSFYGIGRQRTPAQDVSFIVEELCQVAARALSPGINDPFTAISCLDWLSAGISCTLGASSNEETLCDDEGDQRVMIQRLTFAALCEQIFGCLRPYIVTDYNACLHTGTLMKNMLRCEMRSNEAELLNRHALLFRDEFVSSSTSEENISKIKQAFANLTDS